MTTRNDIFAMTTAGRVRGVGSPMGVTFRGIPFAAPPVGDRRFRPPVAAERWEGTLDCTASRPTCPQSQMATGGPLDVVLLTKEPMDEACLFLNVWTPGVDDRRRPTMVSIHGGGFTSGSGSTPLLDGAAFARDGVVFVSMNYRLHALGFLHLAPFFPELTSANLGLLDQIAALRWVRDNVRAFGGDPDNVTIFGESAGGMSVAALLAMPAAKGLFRRAILQSGAGHVGLGPATASRVAERTLELLDVRPGDWGALRATPVEKIVAVATQIAHTETSSLLDGEGPVGRMCYQPIIDGMTLAGRPVDRIAAGAASDVPLMIGTSADEWRLFIWALPEAIRSMIPEIDVAPYFAPAGRTAADALAVYASGRPSSTRQDLLAAVESDWFFGVPAVRLAEAQAAQSRDVWMFRFSWRSPEFDGTLGACHALDLPFVFDNVGEWSVLVGDDAPVALAKVMHETWVRFAATGIPTAEGLPEWPPYDTRRRAVMDFDVECRVVDDPRSAERRLWDGLLMTRREKV